MNFKLTVIILVVIIGVYQTVLNVVRQRSANNPTPDNLSDVYDAETYSRWKMYSAEYSKLSILSGLVSCIIPILLLVTNAYSLFASIFPGGAFMQLFAVILLEVVVSTVVSSVFSYISTMKIEEKYGFNRSTKKTFIFDKIREFIVEMVISLGLSTLLWLLYTALGDWLVLLFAVAVFIIVLAITFLYPLLSRIGNTFTPLADGDLKDSLMELLTKHGYKVKAIEVMDASRRTTKLNAYFTGFGKMKTIVLYDNLVNTMTTDEICAVFAHELGHGLHRDVIKSQLLNFGNLLIMSLIVWVTVKVPQLHTAFGFEGVNFGFAYVLLSVGLGVVQPFTSLVINARSRCAEYRADKQSVEEGYKEPMVTALKKLARENFAHLSPSRINVLLEYSHPPLAERISAIEKN
ncbi:MAG: M48 family metallopeptidase [Clostridia bacterium]|nr:M48 family metallopeptidase [Clostridia bacterium]